MLSLLSTLSLFLSLCFSFSLSLSSSLHLSVVKWTVGVMSQRIFQPIIINTWCLSLDILTFLIFLCLCLCLCVCICHCHCHCWGSVDSVCHQLSENIWFGRLTVVLWWLVQCKAVEVVWILARTGGRTGGWTGIEGTLRGPRGPKKIILTHNPSFYIRGSVSEQVMSILYAYSNFHFALKVTNLKL